MKKKRKCCYCGRVEEEGVEIIWIEHYNSKKMFCHPCLISAYARFVEQLIHWATLWKAGKQ